MNTLKKLITLLALLLPVSASAIALPPTDYVNYEFEVDGIYYKIVDDEAWVTFRSYESGNHIGGYGGEVVIPSTVTYQGKLYPVTTIDNYAFNYCQGLRSITIPESIKMIGGGAFCLCTGLTRVTITDIEAWCRCIIVGTDSNPLFYAQHLYLNDTEVTDLTIPDGITAIGKNAFLGWAGLTSVTIPNSVTSIGDNAFNCCTGLTNITIPNSVTEIGQVAFEGCTALTSVTLGNAVTAIGGSAFAGCSALTGIVIPNSVTNIGVRAFSDCTSLASATIGKSVTSIGTSAFRNCAALTSIDIPNSVTEIGTFAFSGCSELSSITIGSAVATIGKDAFQNDPSIEAVTSKATTPPSWGDLSMFTTNVYNHAPLHVPTDAERAYKTNQYWGQFLTIIGDVTNDNPSGDEDGYEYVPFVREGVKWVYVCKNPYWEEEFWGQEYYSFEMKSDVMIGDKYYKPVQLTHYLDNMGISTEVEDFTPVYLREEDKVVYAIVPDGILHPQCPIGFFSYIGFQDPWLTTTDQEFMLYDFNNPMSLYEDWVEYNGISLENIGGHISKCHHYTWDYGEDEVIIEGIGYDGAAGMPLFYFENFITGMQVTYYLSHVIEDGEIIYKGMRYRPYVPGDVNGDGETTVADANSVIDVVIMGGNAGHTRIPAADVNGDGEVNIADVNAIIDMILSQQFE